MHTAAKENHEYTVHYLAELGADIDIKDNDGVSETLIITAGRLAFPQAHKEPLHALLWINIGTNTCMQLQIHSTHLR